MANLSSDIEKQLSKLKLLLEHLPMREDLTEITDDMIPEGANFVFEQDVDLKSLSLFDVLSEKELVTIQPPTKGTVAEKPTQPQPPKMIDWACSGSSTSNLNAQP
ncbi:hypothetical protein M422DRAFT_277306 [Sphaerobolus stellatus SS14]|uniref:Uncharacterized protein n=1 Tax=Sphaerobolus stellatus (strain SS14) TaxID=990650 RepID=A0A0C9UB14_SPHS4|nr:hypothetical protein M422DRAFT_277306 [Sphaerobolus stellatus SS14]